MSYHLSVSRTQIEAIIKALKVTPPSLEGIPEESIETENLTYLTECLEDTLKEPEDDNMLHGINL